MCVRFPNTGCNEWCSRRHSNGSRGRFISFYLYLSSCWFLIWHHHYTPYNPIIWFIHCQLFLLINVHVYDNVMTTMWVGNNFFKQKRVFDYKSISYIMILFLRGTMYHWILFLFLPLCRCSFKVVSICHVCLPSGSCYLSITWSFRCKMHFFLIKYLICFYCHT